MNGLVRRFGAAVRSFPWLKWGVALAVFFYLLIAARALMTTQDETGDVKVALPIVLAFLPICTYFLFRYPLIFPFGLYVALTPVDALLTVSGGASLVRFVGIAAAGALVLQAVVQRRVLLPQPGWYAWGAVVAYTTLSMLWTPDQSGAWVEFNSIVMLFVMMTVVAIYRPTPIEFKVAIALFVPCALGMALYAIHQYFTGSASAGDERLALHIGTSYSLDPNYVGGAFLPGIAIALVGLMYTRNLTIRIFCAVSMPAIMAAVFTTGSRSAALAAVGIFLYFAFRSRQLIPVAVVAGLGLGVIAIFPRMLARLFDQTVANGSGRLDIWETGMHSFRDHWLFGSGLDSYMYNYDHNFLQVFQQDYAGWSRPGHSLVFVGLNDYGVVGFSLVLLAWYVSVRQLHVIPRTSSLFGIRVGCEAAIMGLFIQMLFIDPYYVKYVWLAHTLPLLVLNMYAPRALRHRRMAAVPRIPVTSAQPLRGT